MVILAWNGIKRNLPRLYIKAGLQPAGEPSRWYPLQIFDASVSSLLLLLRQLPSLHFKQSTFSMVDCSPLSCGMRFGKVGQVAKHGCQQFGEQFLICSFLMSMGRGNSELTGLLGFLREDLFCWFLVGKFLIFNVWHDSSFLMTTGWSGWQLDNKQVWLANRFCWHFFRFVAFNDHMGWYVLGLDGFIYYY